GLAVAAFSLRADQLLDQRHLIEREQTEVRALDLQRLQHRLGREIGVPDLPVEQREGLKAIDPPCGVRAVRRFLMLEDIEATLRALAVLEERRETRSGFGRGRLEPGLGLCDAFPGPRGQDTHKGARCAVRRREAHRDPPEERYDGFILLTKRRR